MYMDEQAASRSPIKGCCIVPYFTRTIIHEAVVSSYVKSPSVAFRNQQCENLLY